MTANTLPILALTMGDAAGVGPEIIVKALGRADVRGWCRPLVVGDAAILRDNLRFWNGPNAPRLVQVDAPDAVGVDPDAIYLFQPGAPLAGIVPGQLSAEAGRGAVEFVMAAIKLAERGQVAGIVTAPLNKEAMHRAGYSYPGHTELLAEQFGVSTYSLVLAARGQFVFHVTTHVSLRDAIDLITFERVLGQIRLAHFLAQALDQPEATIAVAGLNPHAGEGGLFGREEIEIIGPAVVQAQQEGIPAVGPLPADVLFPRAAAGRYKFVIALYHDQGHVVFKTLFFDEGVNVTVGLPVIRTSVDHGTAFDIAGHGIAREESLVEAIKLAARLGPKWGQICAKANLTL
ncbi:MAG: 4-hydroxythreonine-4-phosphate dehydrogenase PdxA [Anaerolineales bacterium]|nr:4-hydroxythreonine-4-phosphate dehydrogenase PdxA [Anaerolineales bacterium]